MQHSKRKTLYLVDGTAQVFRAYFAVRSLSTSTGMPTNAVFGFVSMLRKLIRDERPDYLAVAFDLEGPTFRHEKYEQYKANRPAPPEDLNVQFPQARQVCETFRIPILERPGFEADDLIATYCRLALEAGLDVVVVASDKDLLQLVGDGVTSFNPGKDLHLDSAGVEKHFGVPPEYVRDVLGLMGDAVDNIPGIPGVGAKTAREMVATYGPIEEIVSRAARFVAAYDSRDTLVAAAGDLMKSKNITESQVGAAAEALTAFTAAMGTLKESEADRTMRDRFAEVLSVAEGIDTDGWIASIGEGGQALTGEIKPLIKALKGLDPKSGKRNWYSVHENREKGMLSKDLATLNDRVPVEVEPTAMELQEPDREKAAALFRSLEFRSLTEEFSREPDPRDRVPEVEKTGAAGGGYRTILEAGALKEVVEACRDAGVFAVDTETDGLDPMRARLVGISLSVSAGHGVYIPVGHDYQDAPVQLSLEEVRGLLGPLLADGRVGKIGQNIKYDLHILRRHGMPVEGIELDTMVAAFLVHAGRTSYKMDLLAEEYLGYETIRYDDVAGTGSSRKTLNQVDIDTVTDYAAEDADITLRLAAVLTTRMEEARLTDLYVSQDGPLLPILAGMEARGILVDPEVLTSMSSEMSESMAKVTGEIHAHAGCEFNIDSPKQLREVLFERLSLKSRRKTAKGKLPSTDARTLEEISGQHPIAAKIMEYRELAKLKGTYVDTLPLLINPDTGRVHTSYNPTGAATGRLSSSDPNLQNIPARSEAGLRIREAFVPASGHLFLAADYSQMELRVLAHLCKDPELITAFNSGQDIHRHTAAAVFGVPPALVAPDMRRRAKAVNFGILYGMSEHRLAKEQQISHAEARAFIQTYFERFGMVRTYIDQVRNDALRDAAVRTMFGRIRYFPQLHQRTGRVVREQALRAALNTTIQGSAADLMKLAMLRVNRELEGSGLGAAILLQVHDELLLEVPEEEMEEVSGMVRKAMEQVHPLRVPLTVDIKTGGNWREVT